MQFCVLFYLDAPNFQNTLIFAKFPFSSRLHNHFCSFTNFFVFFIHNKDTYSQFLDEMFLAILCNEIFVKENFSNKKVFVKKKTHLNLNCNSGLVLLLFVT